jgi:hypothetical protein
MALDKLPLIGRSGSCLSFRRLDSGTLTDASTPRVWRRNSVPRWAASGSTTGTNFATPVCQAGPGRHRELGLTRHPHDQGSLLLCERMRLNSQIGSSGPRAKIEYLTHSFGRSEIRLLARCEVKEPARLSPRAAGASRISLVRAVSKASQSAPSTTGKEFSRPNPCGSRSRRCC